MNISPYFVRNVKFPFQNRRSVSIISSSLPGVIEKFSYSVKKRLRIRSYDTIVDFAKKLGSLSLGRELESGFFWVAAFYRLVKSCVFISSLPGAFFHFGARFSEANSLNSQSKY